MNFRFGKLVSITLFILSLTSTNSVLASPQQIAQIKGRILPGKTVQHLFFVDPTKQLYLSDDGRKLSLFSERSDLKLIFIDPAGKRIGPVIRLEKQRPGMKGEFVSRRVIDNPVPGRWILELSLSEQARPVQYTVNISAKDPIYELDASHIYHLNKPGELIRLEIKLLKQRKPFSEASVIGNLEKRFNFDEINLPKQLIFNDDGVNGDLTGKDGIYTATLTPDKPGSYWIEVHATDGKSFERIAWRGVDVFVPGGIQLTGRITKEIAIDDDRDGKYEALNIIVEIEVSDTQSHYGLYGKINSLSGKLIGLPPRLSPAVQVMLPGVYGNVPRSTGLHEVVISFPGEWFIISRQDGPYLVYIDGNDWNITGQPLDRLRQPYKTKPYHWKEFEVK